MIKAQFLNYRDHNLQIVVETDERLIIVFCILFKHEVADGQLGQTMLFLVRVGWQGCKQSAAQRRCLLRGIQVEELGVFGSAAEAFGVVSQFVRKDGRWD